MSTININNLSFSYSKTDILENINLDVQDKDFLAIIGPNGGGKSTLLKLILGFNEPKEGTIKIDGEQNTKKLSNIGYVPQNTNININFPIKVIDVVMMGHIRDEKEKKQSKNFLHKYFNIGYNEFEKSCALNALAQVDMKDYANQKIGNLSGGQRQRVMIARALCAHPDILLLDEPTASIDVTGQKQVYELLKELNKDITIVVVSHDISIIFAYANKVAHINKNLTFHDISDKNDFECEDDEHFCEVEMFRLMGQKACKC